MIHSYTYHYTPLRTCIAEEARKQSINFTQKTAQETGHCPLCSHRIICIKTSTKAHPNRTLSPIGWRQPPTERPLKWSFGGV